MGNRGNGCGPKGIAGKLIPDTIFGLSVHEACNHHDQMYYQGGSGQERKEADEKFLKDMLSEVKRKKGLVIVQAARKLGAYLYYYSVRIFGRFFFGK